MSGRPCPFPLAVGISPRLGARTEPARANRASPGPQGAPNPLWISALGSAGSQPPAALPRPFCSHVIARRQISFHNSPATPPLRVVRVVHVLPHPPHAPTGLALLQRRLLPSDPSHQPPADVKGALTSCWDGLRAPVTTHVHERAPLRRPYRGRHRGSRFPFAAPSVQTDKNSSTLSP